MPNGNLTSILWPLLLLPLMITGASRVYVQS
ncbi:hypothetical protein PVAP13_3NG031000 [Panicum virgatum]|uniref:Uncharacterized protein n=1 Tax=Panicum virgatum TaxID=38727 RepID=A0A8T0U2Q6_PANVG|nr:hypothetical protein PVAP13_3NG031000 [Panicum virgatum]